MLLCAPHIIEVVRLCHCMTSSFIVEWQVQQVGTGVHSEGQIRQLSRQSILIPRIYKITMKRMLDLQARDLGIEYPNMYNHLAK